MCTQFNPSRNEEWYARKLKITIPQEPFPATCFPGSLAPFLVKGKQSGRLACGLAQFGLIPHWAKDRKISRMTYNARAETVAEKPSYRSAWRQRQFGLLVVDEFFEPSYATGSAVRWRIAQPSGEPLAIACIWDRWVDGEAAAHTVSFSMLTINADAHPVMRQFHRPEDEKRSPVILSSQWHEAWLSANARQAEEMMNASFMPELCAEAAPVKPLLRSPAA